MIKAVKESGQALVLVLLSMAVVITVVLFVLSRSVTDISVSDSESQSISAFSAAEAGVEQALVIGENSGNIGEASYDAQITNVASGTTNFVYPVELNSGDTMTLWLNSQDGSPDYTGSSLRVCWGKEGTSNASDLTPAIEVSVVYGIPTAARILRAAIDPYQSQPRSPTDNSFAPASLGSTIAGQSFPFCYTLNNLNLLGNLQFATVRMFYNTDTSHPVGFSSLSASTFPTQGLTIESSGTAGQSNRKVEVFQSWPEVPSTFMHSVYSSVGITK